MNNQELSGKEHKELSGAILNSYKKLKDLEMMLKYKLDMNLHESIKEDSLDNMVFDLISKFDSRDAIDELVLAAISYKTNPSLDAFAMKKNISSTSKETAPSSSIDSSPTDCQTYWEWLCKSSSKNIQEITNAGYSKSGNQVLFLDEIINELKRTPILEDIFEEIFQFLCNNIISTVDLSKKFNTVQAMSPEYSYNHQYFPTLSLKLFLENLSSTRYNISYLIPSISPYEHNEMGKQLIRSFLKPIFSEISVLFFSSLDFLKTNSNSLNDSLISGLLDNIKSEYISLSNEIQGISPLPHHYILLPSNNVDCFLKENEIEKIGLTSSQQTTFFTKKDEKYFINLEKITPEVDDKIKYVNSLVLQKKLLIQKVQSLGLKPIVFKVDSFFEEGFTDLIQLINAIGGKNLGVSEELPSHM